MKNQEILTCWWVLDHFGSQNFQRRWVPPRSVDVIVTLHVHHKIQQINTCYKILQKDNVFVVINFVFSFSIYCSSHSSSSTSSNLAPDIFPAFNYTIVSKLSQLKKQFHTDIFHVLFKNYFPRC